MAEVIPLNWRNSIEELRQKIGDATRRWLAKFKRQGSENGEPWSPAVFETIGYGIELDEDDEKLIARAMVPKLGKNDFKVEVTKDRLVIRGGRQSSRKSRHGYEESRASFAQAISLPCEVDPDRATARLRSGLLTVALPKSEHAKSRRVKIQVC